VMQQNISQQFPRSELEEAFEPAVEKVVMNADTHHSEARILRINALCCLCLISIRHARHARCGWRQRAASPTFDSKFWPSPRALGRVSSPLCYRDALKKHLIGLVELELFAETA
jgi:hypothetical protein